MHDDGTSIGVADVAKGLVAGAVGGLAKYAVTSYLYAHENAAAREREDAARGNEHAYETAARKGAAFAGRELSDAQKARAGSVLHWGLNLAPVTAYALLRKRYPQVARGHGLAFGLPLTWLAMDEGLNPALGLTPGPTAFPWQTHARGLAGHTTLWLTAETALRVMDGRPGAA